MTPLEVRCIVALVVHLSAVQALNQLVDLGGHHQNVDGALVVEAQLLLAPARRQGS